MIPEDLEARIQEALADGAKPFFVSATGGTTVMGAFDPINEIADICQKYDMWFHVDVNIYIYKIYITTLTWKQAIGVCPDSQHETFNGLIFKAHVIAILELIGNSINLHYLFTTTTTLGGAMKPISNYHFPDNF